MLRGLTAFAVVAVTVGLTAAAIEFVPHTLFFPIVEVSLPGGLRVTALQPGLTEKRECESSIREVTSRLDAYCQGCEVVQRCPRGLPTALRGALSHEAMAQPSARAGDGGLTLVFLGRDPAVTMDACRQSQQLSASYAVESRLECFAAGVPR
jgi:hypothetical protein